MKLILQHLRPAGQMDKNTHTHSHTTIVITESPQANKNKNSSGEISTSCKHVVRPRIVDTAPTVSIVQLRFYTSVQRLWSTLA